MAGEMSQSEVTREAYPFHFAIADKFKGEVRAFDQYQGPYVRSEAGKFWIQTAEGWDGGELLQVYNETTDMLSNPFGWNDSDIEAVHAAEQTL